MGKGNSGTLKYNRHVEYLEKKKQEHNIWKPPFKGKEHFGKSIRIPCGQKES